MSNGAMVLWFTGLSGSGKSTIANALFKELEKRHKKAFILDGDAIRNTVHRHLSFSPEDIQQNNALVAKLCVKYQEKYDVIIVPIISPFIESRQNARRIVGDRFVEVYIKASLDKVIQRDTKGLYKKAMAGEIPNFIGIDPKVPYEQPLEPDILLDTEELDIATAAKHLLEFVFTPADRVP